MKKRKIKDLIAQILTYLFSSFGLVTFIAILVFVFSNGLSTLSFEMLTSDYHQEVVNVNYEQENYMQFEEKEIEDSYFSISAHIPAGSEVSASDISSLSAISPC